MGFFGDLFLGSRPDMQLPGYASGYQDEMRGNMVGIGKAAKQGKHLWKQYMDDPESLATQSLNQGAVQRQTAEEDYASGANALLAHSGSGNAGQQALQQRMKEMQMNRINQNQGIAAQQEAQSKGFGGLSLWQQGIENRDRVNLGYSGLIGSAMNQAYDRRRQGGLFNPQTWGNALGAFAGGAGMGI